MEIELFDSYISTFEYPIKYRVIPSFLTLTHNHKKLLNISYKVAPILFLVWLFFLNHIYVFLRMIFFLLKILPIKRIDVSGKVYLDLSDSKYLHSVIGDKPDSVILFNKKKKKHLPKNMKILNYLSIIKIKNIFKASVYAVFSTYYLFYKKKANQVLYTYSAFQWFLLYFTLKETKIDHIWISNHYDRYAKLVDSLEIKYSLIQHGQLYFMNEIKSEIVFPNFSEGLMNCSKVYMFDYESNHYFKKYISSNYEIQLINSPLQIKKYNEINYDLPVLLIIGVGPYVLKHKKIMKYLIDKYFNKLNVVYRFHPTQSNIKFDFPITLYNYEKFAIPHSDIVYTYGSSIDIEINKLLPKAVFVKTTNDLYNLIELKTE
jgi:hypothetical protein